MKRVLSLPVAIFLCSISTIRADSLPSIDDVITKYVNAAGGRELAARRS